MGTLRLAGSRLFFDADWTPNVHIWSMHDEGGTLNGISSDLYTVRPDGTGLTPITRTRKGEVVFTGDWSPDGTRISLVHYQPRDNDLEIQTMAADGSDPRPSPNVSRRRSATCRSGGRRPRPPRRSGD